jgi:DNA-binding LacI/PurR family transcriptional regulator
VTTTKDIAARLDLSVSTVGRALADDPRISAATKFRVRQAADELGYVANRAARMMRGVRSTVVGLVVPDVGNSFYSAVAHALTETMRSRDHQVMLCETGDDAQTELRQIRDLAAVQVAGVVIVPTARPHPEVRRLLQAIPHVQLNRRVPGLSPHWFGIDDHGVTHTATTHLLELGHRRIAYIGGAVDIPTGAERLAGFRDAISEAGLGVECGIAELGRPSQATHGGDALRRLLNAPEPPTALVTGTVQMTVGVLAAAHADGLAVPRRLSIVGFGDEPGFAWWGRGLTTVALPVHEVATACGAWLLHRLHAAGDGTSLAPFASASSGTLVVRGSTAAPAAVSRPARGSRAAR